MKVLCHVMSFCIVAVGLARGGSACAQSQASAVAFKRLTSLAGKWTGFADGQEVVVRYSLIANGSTLLEEFVPPDRTQTMLTMFSQDGDRLIATHYCAAGNQPHMATNEISRAEGNPFKFSLMRVTGMRSAVHDWHNTSLEILLEDADHVTQSGPTSTKASRARTLFTSNECADKMRIGAKRIGADLLRR